MTLCFAKERKSLQRSLQILHPHCLGGLVVVTADPFLCFALPVCASCRLQCHSSSEQYVPWK